MRPRPRRRRPRTIAASPPGMIALAAHRPRRRHEAERSYGDAVGPVAVGNGGDGNTKFHGCPDAWSTVDRQTRRVAIAAVKTAVDVAKSDAIVASALERVGRNAGAGVGDANSEALGAGRVDL